MSVEKLSIGGLDEAQRLLVEVNADLSLLSQKLEREDRLRLEEAQERLHRAIDHVESVLDGKRSH